MVEFKFHSIFIVVYASSCAQCEFLSCGGFHIRVKIIVSKMGNMLNIMFVYLCLFWAEYHFFSFKKYML